MRQADIQSVAIVYVSTDTSLQLYSAATANQPWLKMIYKDGSDFAAVGEEMTEETSRDEDFIQAAVSKSVTSSPPRFLLREGRLRSDSSLIFPGQS